MTLTDDQLAEFEDAAEGQLTAEAQHAFEARIAVDAELRIEWEAYCRFRHGLESVAMKRDLERLHQQLSLTESLGTHVPERGNVPDSAPVRPLPVGNRRAWWWAAAGLLVAMLGTWWWQGQQRTEALQALYTANYRPEPTIRGSGCSPALAGPIALYRARQYKTALAELTRTTNPDACAPYYRGLCLLALDDPQNAELSLLAAKRLSTGNLRQRTEWFLALTYLRLAEATPAQAELQQIAAQLGHPFRPKAQQLLIELTR
jgi:hypothetical protein